MFDFFTSQTGAKRHKKVLSGSIKGITKPALRRLARRGGVTRLSGAVYESARNAMKAFVESVIYYALQYNYCFKRKTVSIKDINMALRRRGYSVLGGAPKKRSRKRKAGKGKKKSSKGKGSPKKNESPKKK